jgi:hypothetical protein
MTFRIEGLFFGMLSVEVCLQGVKPRAPKGAEFLRPGMDLLKRFGPELIKPVAAFAALGNKVDVLEDFKMLGDRRKRNSKGPGELGGGAFAGLEGLKHPAPRWVGDGVEDVIFL